MKSTPVRLQLLRFAFRKSVPVNIESLNFDPERSENRASVSLNSELSNLERFILQSMRLEFERLISERSAPWIGRDKTSDRVEYSSDKSFTNSSGWVLFRMAVKKFSF